MLDIWKWRNASFSRGPLKVISNRRAGNAGSLRKRSFSDFQDHYREDECGGHCRRRCRGRTSTVFGGRPAHCRAKGDIREDEADLWRPRWTFEGKAAPASVDVRIKIRACRC